MTEEEIRKCIEEKEVQISNQLKDFQLATVKRVTSRFRDGQNRILVSDEVGLGKTMVAQGVIVSMARIRMLEEHDDNFKVIYVCSNQSIANQNIDTLDIFGCGRSEIGSRLSEVHFGMARKRADKKDDNFIEMIPLTPSTSFKIAAGAGTKWERALMFSILKRIPDIKIAERTLSEFLRNGVGIEGWNGTVEWFDSEIARLDDIPELNYPNSVINEILSSHRNTINKLTESFSDGNTPNYPSRLIGELRTMFAEISVGELNPDLVIMDEFQRFKFLIDGKNPEANVISRRFLTNKYDDDEGRRLRVLLLSATPYKLYSTFEEREQALGHIDEHYTEFLNVMHFLEEGGQNPPEFDTVWNDYSKRLHQLHRGQECVDGVIDAKNKAEDQLFRFMCRTERLSVMDSQDYIDDTSRNSHLAVSEYDIKEYVEIMSLLRELKINKRVPIDYVKSCPYILSFMHNYEVKRILNAHFKKHPKDIDKAGIKDSLWLNKSFINAYKPLPDSNSRLKILFSHCFQGNSAMFLWMPPTAPYYTLEGVYKGAEELNFSKILLFSAWEMVPRMIACLTSYESERRTVAELCRAKDKPVRYDVDRKKRYPAQRLTFRMRKDDDRKELPATMTLFSLIYPSKVLSDAYIPCSFMNNGLRSLPEVETEVKSRIKERLQPLIDKYGEQGGSGDAWYYMAPILMDLFQDNGYVKIWLDGEKKWCSETGSNDSAYAKHLSEIESRISDLNSIQLGKLPEDLLQVLTDMALGGFATCILRTIAPTGATPSDASRLAKSFSDRFNTTETVAIVELSSGSNDDSHHWEDMLKYSKNGCFQSMFDEYFNLIFGGKQGRIEEAVKQIVYDLDMGTVSNKVEGYRDYKRAVSKSEEEDSDKTSMRCHFAMGFSAGSSTDEKSTKTKDNIRHAFNSPLRPFVLASTSIGQEGLDFHTYCRKIMHWNLPSNPVDLEQREGRINRFKCLAIRQNIAKDYFHSIEFKNDVWDDLFSAAEKDKAQGEPDLIPFWCYNRADGIKIERILPLYPLSSDISKYERMIEILSSYRLTLGQARQEELLEFVFKNFDDVSQLDKLFFDLSPFFKS